MTAGGSSTPEVQRLLAVLAAAKGGRIAELGTAFGEGARAIADAMSADATFVTVEPDEERFRIACQRLAGTRAEVVHGRWQDVLPQRAPFDLLFFDGDARGPDAATVVGLLAPGGIIIKDDMTPGRAIEGDPIRELLLCNQNLAGVEILTRPDMAAIIAVRR